MTDFILIRHGETDWNRELRFQGQVDVSLNATGHEQALRLAGRLAREHADALYASDLLRARQTARPIADALSLRAVQVPALREQSFGLVDGMCVDEIKQQHPGAWQGWLRFEADYRMPEGESLREFHVRVIAALEQLADGHRGQTVLVVTHGGVLDMVYRTARSLGLEGPRESEIPNAGINRVRMAGDGIDIVSWAEVDHLADLPPQPVYDQRKYAATAGRPSAA